MRILFLLQKLRKRLKRTLDARLIRSSDLFDPQWYLEHNPDIAQSGLNPVYHYLVYGGLEGRAPGPNFDSGWYMEKYEDVRSFKQNPLVHYLRYGQAEQRKCMPPAFSLRRLYDYSKEKGYIAFEDVPEQVYLHRPKVTGNFSRTLNEGEALCPRPYVAVIEEAIIFGGENLVIVEGNTVLNDELVDFNSRDFGKKVSRIREVDQTSVILTDYVEPKVHIEEGILISCGHDANYFHWLVECLPKLLLIDSLEEFKDIPLVIPRDLHTNLMAALERVNVHNRPILFLEMGTPCSVDRLIVPSTLSRIVDRYQGSPVFNVDIVLSHKWLTRVSELLISHVNDQEKPWRKLFLTRRKGFRALGNRDELELMLLEQGFEIVELEGASLDFQIELFSQASIVVAPTGAALTNMLFCRPGTKVLIFMSDHETSNFYFWSNLGALNNLDVTMIVGKRLFTLTGYWSVHDDYEIDPNLVLNLTEQGTGLETSFS